MVNLYRELQPVDRLSIRIPFPLSSYERKLVTLLYQPLIGPDAVSLYFMLWAEGEDMIDTNLSHYHLMNALDMPIAKVFESRIALEAIGLLRSWRREDETMRSFIYDVMPPLDAKLFFDDPILSMFLYSKIGEHAYRTLRQRFIPKGSTTEGFKDVSRSFMDVYQPVQQHMPPNDLQMSTGVEKPKDIPFDHKGFDFDALRQGLSEQLIPQNVLTVEVKALIAKLAFLYHLSPKDMQQIVMMSLDEMMQVSEAKLKKSASSYYKMTMSTEPPAMHQYVQVVEAAPEAEETEKPQTKKQELIEWFTKASPLDVLTNVAGGKKPFPKDVELAEDLVVQYDMEPQVVNVLLHYVCLRNGGKLNRKYIESIASHWRNTGVKTAEEAMELAKEFEHRVQPTTTKITPSTEMHEQFKLLRAAAGSYYLIESMKDVDINEATLKADVVKLFEQTEPLVLLQMMNDGKEPIGKDIRVVEEACEAYEDLPKDVMNALIHYGYFITTNSLNMNFLQSILSSWRKENIQTAAEALEYAKAYQQAKSQKYYKTTYPQKPQVDESLLPEWFKNEQHKKHKQDAEPVKDFEAERQKILEQLGLDKG
ncbi:DnaD domain protein [Kurthia massiliensis]|uniref:DnaD domain protein n=1 Tax=Kurthia massiliensis TaxID=1033739 RepID=UPI00028A3EF8|nr:DnaD domain protein [Kurthia massiliensis]